jgi:hypothetical protein
LAFHGLETLPLVARSDALVDDVDWRDTGCEVAPACLTCPLAVCRYDASAIADYLAGQQARLRSQRARARDLLAKGESVSCIAAALGVSRRTVFRYLEGDTRFPS